MSQEGAYISLASHGLAVGWDTDRGISLSYFTEAALGVSGSAWGTFYIDPREFDFTAEGFGQGFVGFGGSLYLGGGTPIGTPAVAFQIQQNQASGDMFLTLGTGVEGIFEVGFYSEGNNGWNVSTLKSSDHQFQSDGVTIVSETTISANGNTLINTYVTDLEGNRVTPAEAKPFLEQAGYDVSPAGTVYTVYKSSSNGTITETENCFLAGTQITMFDGTTKNIEDITPDDIVMSYDEAGKLVPGRVTKTFQNQVKHILNVHGLMVTPGHVTLCGDGAFKGQHVPMIDIIRSDGAVVKTDGTLVRMNTNCTVGSYEDQFVLLAIGEMGKEGLTVRDQGRVRIGSRFILPDGRDMSIAEILAASGATVNDDGLVISDTMPEPTPLHLSFLDAMPQVEDYILARSGLSLDEIYDAGEWEATRPQMPAPMWAIRKPSRAEVLKAEANYKSPPKLH